MNNASVNHGLIPASRHLRAVVANTNQLMPITMSTKNTPEAMTPDIPIVANPAASKARTIIMGSDNSCTAQYSDLVANPVK